jgi:flagellar biogenesis protein FliO
VKPTADVKPAANIEKTPIRKNTVEEKAPATSSSTGSALSGLGSTGQVIAALAIVLGLILIGRALVRKFVPGAGASNGKGVIEILARHPLSKNQAIVLVRIGSQIVALNQGRDASHSVLVINEPMEVARIIGQIEGKNPASMQAGFNKLLANARMDLESGGNDVETQSLGDEDLDEQLDEMAAAKRQLMELRQHVRSVRDSLPREA